MARRWEALDQATRKLIRVGMLSTQPQSHTPSCPPVTGCLLLNWRAAACSAGSSCPACCCPAALSRPAVALSMIRSQECCKWCQTCVYGCSDRPWAGHRGSDKCKTTLASTGAVQQRLITFGSDDVQRRAFRRGCKHTNGALTVCSCNCMSCSKTVPFHCTSN